MNEQNYIIDGTKLVKYIGDEKLAVIPEGITEIGEEAFANSTIYGVSFPSSLRTIGKHAFLDCMNLSKITIPYGVEFIDEYAFKRNNGACLDIYYDGPEFLTRAWDFDWNYKSFFATHSTTYNEEKLEEVLTSDELRLHNKCKELGLAVMGSVLYEMDPSIEGTIEIPEGVTVIKSNSFWPSCEIERVIIPSSVKVIEDGAFCGCESLKEIIVKEGVGVIESTAFAGCKKLESLIIPASASVGFGIAMDCNKKLKITVVGATRAPEEWDPQWRHRSLGLLRLQEHKNIVFEP